jgi:hypothetical protein
MAIISYIMAIISYIMEIISCILMRRWCPFCITATRLIEYLYSASSQKQQSAG